MTFDAARDAIAAHLATQLPILFPPTPYVRWPNEPKVTAPAATLSQWFRVSFQMLRSQHPAIGAGRKLRDRANVVVEIFTQAGAGDQALMAAEGSVRGIFAGLTVSGARFSDTEDEAPRFVDVGLVTDLGTWWKGIVIAPFRYDYTL